MKVSSALQGNAATLRKVLVLVIVLVFVPFLCLLRSSALLFQFSAL